MSVTTDSPPPDPSVVRVEGPWRHLDVRANGIRFHAAEHQAAEHQAGDRAAVEYSGATRPLVLLLHGFGQIWWAWRNQLGGIDPHRFRVVAVDLRGYGDTDKPPRGYDGWTLAGDVYGLIRALGHSEATLVGHADGGLGAWACAALHPRAVHKMVVIGSPHPRVLREDALRIRGDRRPFLREFLGNQVPRLAERALTRDDGAFIADMLSQRSGPAWRATDDFRTARELYRTAVQIPGVAHSSLEYRRWAFRSQFRPDGGRFGEEMESRIDTPVLALRGDQDPYIAAELVSPDATADYAADYRLLAVAGSGHYAHEEQPDAVNTAITGFLTA